MTEYRKTSKWTQKIPQIDVERYLQRIGYEDISLPNLDYLKKLHKHHLFNIPFENLDIHWQRKIILDLDLIYKKVVVNRRGGFCYELNGLFHALLLNLGFKCHLVSCRVFNDKSEEGQEGDHMAILVLVNDQLYLADVGFGELFLEPKELKTNHLQVDYNKYFRFLITPDEEFLITSSTDARVFKKEYIFSTKVRQFIEFIPRCEWQQSSSQSHFTQKKVCTRATPEGRITLTDEKLIETIKGKRTETDLLNTDDFNTKLSELFGIQY